MRRAIDRLFVYDSVVAQQCGVSVTCGVCIALCGVLGACVVWCVLACCFASSLRLTAALPTCLSDALVSAVQSVCGGMVCRTIVVGCVGCVGCVYHSLPLPPTGCADCSACPAAACLHYGSASPDAGCCSDHQHYRQSQQPGSAVG